jgi:sucrose-6-phosphate hydrolase SacC (GH32 family)
MLGRVFASSDFRSWSPLGTEPMWTSSQYGGMWECPDLYAVSAPSDPMVLKISTFGGDWYMLGYYDMGNNSFQPALANIQVRMCSCDHLGD